MRLGQKSNLIFYLGRGGFLLDFLHARKVSQLNLWFKFAQFPHYPNFASLNTYGNPPNHLKAFLILPPFNKKRRQMNRLLFFIWAGVDCLESLALNVSTCFAFVILSLGKSTSHSARSSLEPDKALLCCGSHPLIHINKKRLGDKLQPLFKKLGQGWIRTTVHSREQIYSLSPLATRPPTLIKFALDET